ncbi:MAG: hypothetical protein P4N59_20115 [Negativicutes bacterium]|nr:hypothetical protein [Negativicutes bacterium]
MINDNCVYEYRVSINRKKTSLSKVVVCDIEPHESTTDLVVAYAKKALPQFFRKMHDGDVVTVCYLGEE